MKLAIDADTLMVFEHVHFYKAKCNFPTISFIFHLTLNLTNFSSIQLPPKQFPIFCPYWIILATFSAIVFSFFLTKCIKKNPFALQLMPSIYSPHKWKEIKVNRLRAHDFHSCHLMVNCDRLLPLMRQFSIKLCYNYINK